MKNNVRKKSEDKVNSKNRPLRYSTLFTRLLTIPYILNNEDCVHVRSTRLALLFWTFQKQSTEKQFSLLGILPDVHIPLFVLRIALLFAWICNEVTNVFCGSEFVQSSLGEGSLRRGCESSNGHTLTSELNQFWMSWSKIDNHSNCRAVSHLPKMWSDSGPSTLPR